MKITWTFPWGSLSSINWSWIAGGSISKSCRDWGISFSFHFPLSSTIPLARISFSSEISCCTWKIDKWHKCPPCPHHRKINLESLNSKYLRNEINKSFRYEYDTIVITKTCTFTNYIWYVICNIFQSQLLRGNLQQVTFSSFFHISIFKNYNYIFLIICLCGGRRFSTSSPIRVMFGWVCRAHSNVMWEAARPISRTTEDMSVIFEGKTVIFHITNEWSVKLDGRPMD